MSNTLATVGVLSIGEMGLGIAKLLVAHNYRVVTNVTGRSDDTRARALEGQVELLSSDTELVQAADYILSIVPPRDALFTAQRIIAALQNSPSRSRPLYFLELNAISPRSAREIASLFQDPSSAIPIDGGIIGGPPYLQPSSSSSSSSSVSPPPSTTSTHWIRPSIPLSGPHQLSSGANGGPPSASHLASTLNTRHVSPAHGVASGLKMCFASTSKGFIAICIQAFTTAARLGVLAELQDEMRTFAPDTLKRATQGVTGMAPKAYRWVTEMQEIAETYAEEGGWEGPSLFEGVREVYESVAADEVLGNEKVGERARGTSIEDVAVCMGRSLERKRARKVENGIQGDEVGEFVVLK